MVETTIDKKAGRKGSAIQLIRQRQDEDLKAASPSACLGVHKQQTPKEAKASRHKHGTNVPSSVYHHHT